MRVELHCHSTCSDGSEPPGQVAARARRAGVELFCLTDHDTCAGYPDTREVDGMRVLRGVELSCAEAGRSVHILLYDAAGDDRWHAVDEALAAQHRALRDRVHAIAARLAARGIHIDGDAILAGATGRTVGRPDVARALVAAGAVRSVDEAFDRYLGDGRAADVPLARLSVADGLALGQRVGAVASLAHPHVLGSLAETLIARHRRSGLEAIEACYGRYGGRERKRWLRLARERDLVVTGGSDYHGVHSPDVREPGVDLPAWVVDKLLKWLRI